MVSYPENGLFFIGSGPGSFEDLTLKGLSYLKEAGVVFVEQYTNFSPEIVGELVTNAGIEASKIRIAQRQDLEDNSKEIIDLAAERRVAILVAGDPFMATTHVSMRINAVSRKIPVFIASNTSIFSLAASLTGLQAYKFGRTVTVPFPENRSRYPYEVIAKNLAAGNHSLILLDIDVTGKNFLDIGTVIGLLHEDESIMKKDVLTPGTVLVACVKLGQAGQFVKHGNAQQLMKIKWKDLGAPQSLIICGKLHFSEKEALETLCP
ncbi:MAG: diphthine synthase [Candidatus Hodarchaeales archaeon]